MIPYKPWFQGSVTTWGHYHSLSFAQIYLYLSIQIYPTHILYIYILYRFIYSISIYPNISNDSPLLRSFSSFGSSPSSNVATQKSVMEIHRESHGIYIYILVYIIYISFISHLYIIYISFIYHLYIYISFIYIYHLYIIYSIIEVYDN